MTHTERKRLSRSCLYGLLAARRAWRPSGAALGVGDPAVQQGEQGPEIVIVDEFTGRSMPGRRYGEGLHQAIEAKEGVKIENENMHRF